MTTKFREKAREIKAAGEAERGNFTPDGVPKRMYQYWLRNTNSVKGTRIRIGTRKENFCHFWRVVAIWAPLMWLGSKAQDFLTSKVGIVSMVLTAIAAVVVLVQSTIGWIDFLIGLGGAVIVVATIVGVVLGLAWIKENREDWIPKIAIGLGSVFVIVLFTGFVIDFGWLPVLLWTIGIAAALAALIATAIGVGYVLAALRRIANDKWDAYEKAQVEAYERGEGPNPYEVSERKPAPRWAQAIANFFRGIGDMLILFGQVVRVKKWGICPLVEIDTPKPVGYGVPDEDYGW